MQTGWDSGGHAYFLKGESVHYLSDGGQGWTGAKRKVSFWEPLPRCRSPQSHYISALAFAKCVLCPSTLISWEEMPPPPLAREVQPVYPTLNWGLPNGRLPTSNLGNLRVGSVSPPSDWGLLEYHATPPPSGEGERGSGQGTNNGASSSDQAATFSLPICSHCCISGDRYRSLPSHPTSQISPATLSSQVPISPLLAFLPLSGASLVLIAQLLAPSSPQNMEGQQDMEGRNPWPRMPGVSHHSDWVPGASRDCPDRTSGSTEPLRLNKVVGPDLWMPHGPLGPPTS